MWLSVYRSVSNVSIRNPLITHVVVAVVVAVVTATTMASLLNPLLRATNLRSPLLRVLVPSAAAALALQAAAAAPSILCQTERFYDISGSATVLAVGALSLYLPALRARAAGHITRLPGLLGALGARGGAGGGPAFNWRQLLVTAMAMAWTLRREMSLLRLVLFPLPVFLVLVRHHGAGRKRLHGKGERSR